MPGTGSGISLLTGILILYVCLRSLFILHPLLLVYIYYLSRMEATLSRIFVPTESKLAHAFLTMYYYLFLLL